MNIKEREKKKEKHCETSLASRECGILGQGSTSGDGDNVACSMLA